MGMARVDIADAIGTQNAILHRFGIKVYEQVLVHYKQGHKVELDFSNLENATTGFFHALIGNLFNDLGHQYSEYVEVRGLGRNPTWKEKYDDAIDFVSNPGKAKAIGDISDLFE
jgi:hypothetical protein